MSELMAIRHTQDEFFARDTHNPLTADQKAPFAGLEYSADNGDLRLEVVARAHPDPGPVKLQTSTGGVQACTRVGMFALRAEGQEAQLTIYEGANGLFLPFVDALGGNQTDPAGRHLEPEALPRGHYLVDFNLAYNPYCA